jgi:hypothetical protein
MAGCGEHVNEIAWFRKTVRISWPVKKKMLTTQMDSTPLGQSILLFNPITLLTQNLNISKFHIFL